MPTIGYTGVGDTDVVTSTTGTYLIARALRADLLGERIDTLVARLGQATVNAVTWWAYIWD